MIQSRLINESRRGVTLIETLVVISLIGALMSIVIPSLAAARERGRQAQCASNLRQLQLANDVYANDHDGLYIPGAINIESTNLHRWHGVREHTAESFIADHAPITPYLEDAVVSARARTCPTFQHTLDALAQTGAGFENACGGYAYNNAFIGSVRRPGPGGAWLIQSTATGVRRSVVNRPSDTIAFTDGALASAQGVDGLIEYSFIEPRYWPDFPGARPNPSIHFRHSGQCNVAWLDGHVSTPSRTFSWVGFGYGVDSTTVGLGWFGEHDSNELFDYD